MSADTTNYFDMAVADAKQTAEHYIDKILEQLHDNGSASTDLLNDYLHGDEYHHGMHTDKEYTLTEAEAVLDQLSEYEETDSGLWHGLPPREAISAQAAYTYANAVIFYWQEIIEDINDDAADGILADMIGEDDPADDETVKQCVLEIIHNY